MVANPMNSIKLNDDLYGQCIQVASNAPEEYRPGEEGDVVGYSVKRKELTIEFGDGSDLNVPVRFLKIVRF